VNAWFSCQRTHMWPEMYLYPYLSLPALTQIHSAFSIFLGFVRGRKGKTLPLRTTHFVTLTPRCVWLFLGRSQQARKMFSSVSWKQYSTLRACVWGERGKHRAELSGFASIRFELSVFSTRKCIWQILYMTIAGRETEKHSESARREPILSISSHRPIDPKCRAHFRMYLYLALKKCVSQAPFRTLENLNCYTVELH